MNPQKRRLLELFAVHNLWLLFVFASQIHPLRKVAHRDELGGTVSPQLI